MDEILPRSLQQRNSVDQPIGCTTICVNQPDCEVIGHSEDALAATLNHYYIVAAHIISDTPQGKYQVGAARPGKMDQFEIQIPFRLFR